MPERALFVLLAVFLVGCLVPPATIDVPTIAVTIPAGGETAAVVDIIDGDTIDVDLGGQTYRVRYIGINTPERDQPCYSEATEANRALVENQTVTLVRDVSETDRYGRLLRYVYVGQTFVNAELVRTGYAEAATYPPDVMFSDLFVQLASAAREASAGCWAQDPFGVSIPLPVGMLGIATR